MTFVPVAQARDHLAELVESVQKTHDRVTLTRHGQPAAVLIAADDLDALLETLDLLANPRTVTAMREGEADLVAGRVATMDDLWTAVRDQPYGA